jgi:hypothetical protein
MITFLLKLLGVQIDRAARLTHVELTTQGSMPTWLVMLLAIASVAIALLTYRVAAPHLSGRRRWGLAALRTILLLMVTAMLTRPVLRLTVEGSVRRSLVILVDGTKSMDLPEHRSEPDDLKRAAIGMGLLNPEKGLSQNIDASQSASVASVHRLALIKSVLSGSGANGLKLDDRVAGDFDVRAFLFGAQNSPGPLLTEIDSPPTQPGDSQSTDVPADVKGWSWVDRLGADASSTAIGDAIRQGLARTRGLPLAGIWVITDGQNNSGSSIHSAAELARDSGVPLYLYGVGITAPKDVAVEKPFGPEIAFLNDEATVNVRVRSQGLAGQSGRLSLLMDGKEVDHADVHYGSTDEQVIPLKFTPTQPGTVELTSTIPPRPDESVVTNNTSSTRIRVIDGKIKVLFIEQSPRWEFKYLQALLMRDRRVDLKCVLTEGDPGIASGPDSPYLAQIPPSRDEMLKFDLIILGDVDPHVFSASQMDWVRTFVAQFGGGLLCISGRQFNPWAYAGTPIEKMLPIDVDADSARARTMDSANTAAIHPELTAPGRASPMLRLSDDLQENQRIWDEDLPPLYWDARVARAKPAATVLLADPDRNKESKYGPMPIIALQQYQVGQVMFVGTDNVWRWRKNQGDRYYTALWGQIVQRLALTHLLGGSKRTQIRVDKDTYNVGDKVTIDARLYDKEFAPVTDAAVRGQSQLEGTVPSEVSLRPTPDQPGTYHAEFSAAAPGHYQFWVERGDDPEVAKTRVDFTVVEPRQETEDTAMNESALRDAAAVSNGRFFREEDLYQLPDTLKNSTDHVNSTVEAEVWSSPLYFLTLLALATVEWVWRKASQLK